MNLISRHIEYLIRYNDCVIVPGWGAFIAQYQPATINNNQLLPPSRSLIFNPSLTHDDGLLASSIVRQSAMGYDMAIKLISDEVNALRHQLDISGEVALSKIGTFTRNDEGTMLFEPFNASSSATSFFGLPTINVTPILAQARNEANESSKEGKSDTIYVPIRRSWTRIAASIAVMLGLGFTLSTPIVNDNAHQASVITTPVQPKIELIEKANNSNLVLNISSVDSTEAFVTVDTLQRKQYQAVIAYYKQREEQRKARQEAMLKQIEEQQKQQEALAKANESKTIVAQQPTKVAAQATPTLSQALINNADKYCVVIASLTSRAQAEKFIASTGNRNLQILEKDGKFRVYAATGATYNQALAVARNNGLLSRYNGTWVCKK